MFFLSYHTRQDKGDAAAKELSAATGRKSVFASVDVRKPDTLKAAVQKCIEIYGKIDFVICGTLRLTVLKARQSLDANTELSYSRSSRGGGEFLSSHFWSVRECIPNRD